jgi:integrase/recombinase XerD
MTTELLPKTRLLVSRSACPRELSDFAEWLTAEGYTPAPIHIHLVYLDQALARIGRPHDPRPPDLADVERAFKPRGGPPTRRKLFDGTRRAYLRFLRARGRLIEPKPEDRFASFRCEYEQYLTDVRGLSASSQRQHADTVADFLVRGVASRELSTLTQHDVEAFVVLRSRELSRHSLQHVIAHVRSFLRFCYERQHLSSRLDEEIEAPRIYRGERPPRALPWRTVQALLTSIDRTSTR